jgi:hypothetical protein
MNKTGQLLEQIRDCDGPEKLSEFFHLNAPGVALELAKHPKTDQFILRKLSFHHSITVRHEVAKNINNDIDALNELCDDKDMLVRDYARRTLMKKLSQTES